MMICIIVIFVSAQAIHCDVKPAGCSFRSNNRRRIYKMSLPDALNFPGYWLLWDIRLTKTRIEIELPQSRGQVIHTIPKIVFLVVSMKLIWNHDTQSPSYTARYAGDQYIPSPLYHASGTVYGNRCCRSEILHSRCVALFIRFSRGTWLNSPYQLRYATQVRPCQLQCPCAST